jgi:hypothetical protein
MYFLCCSMYFCVVLCIVCFVSFSVLFVCICVLYDCHRVATQLQLNISHHISYHVSCHIVSYHIILYRFCRFRAFMVVQCWHKTGFWCCRHVDLWPTFRWCLLSQCTRRSDYFVVQLKRMSDTIDSSELSLDNYLTLTVDMESSLGRHIK